MTTVTALPELDYENLDDAGEAHRRLARARATAPIAMGAHGPEILSYDLVRAVLRDDRFVVPPGFALAPQGITSGPLWDRATGSLLCLDGAEHHRLRRLIADQIGVILRRSVDPDRPLAGYGLDSLGALELRTRIENETGIRIAATDIATVTIRGLAGLLCEKLAPPQSGTLREPI